MTEKLYYADSHLSVFTAKVLACEQVKTGWQVVLDRTAFFPEGGGQSADTGTLGGVRVLDAHERGGEVVHLCGAPLTVGENVEGRLDFEQRLRRMQNHSGEHIVSGLVHGRFGFDNVGFHMGEDCMTIDFSGELSPDELTEIELNANETVRADLPIRAWVPGEAELAALDYRSKKELSGQVRIVEIPGIDRCACCAPHVSRTGEIGLIKILSCVSHRGGVRITLICGAEAYADYCDKYRQTLHIAALTASRHSETDQAVEALIAQNKELKNEIYSQKKRLCACIAAHAQASDGNLVVFAEGCDPEELCEIALLLAEKAAGAAVACSGNDDNGYTYAVYCRGAAMNRYAKAVNAALNGRGGGRDELIRGSFRATRSEIETFFRTFEVERP